MDRPTPNDMMPKRDHERDVELDKKIEALRRKNEVLMRRYQEVEEDKKRAEEDGMAQQRHKGKADDLTITISKSTSESRVVVTKPYSGGSPARKGQQEAGSELGGEGPSPGPGRGRRKQLTVTMAGKKGRRVVSERTETTPAAADAKSPTDDGQARRVESAGRGKQLNHVSKRDAAVQEEVKQGQQHADEHQRVLEHCQEPESLPAATDLNVPTTQEEQKEYVKWKKEREQIDRERVARHKNAKGQWRRAWDMDKTDNMFSDKSQPERERGPPGRGSRAAKKGQPRSSDSRGHDTRGKEKGAKNVLVMSSKAKGKDRLTGRARRWQAGEEGEHIESCDTTLEDFLEELDALTDPEMEDHRDQNFKAKSSTSPDVLRRSEEDVDVTGGSPSPVSEDPVTQGKAESSPPRGSERKVRFAEEVGVADAQDSAGSETKGQSSSEASSPGETKSHSQEPEPSLESAKEDLARLQDQGGPPVAEAPQTECSKTDPEPPAAPSSAPLHQSSAHPAELTKCNISTTNTEELMDSGLSVLSLESGDTLAAHATSSNDKAREHGKVV
ncbi:coiled-coil domain-containing protein 9B isoform X2 [Genypterus blacodes]|uniref:coiled-coil domain-containing protein 9B isoform X2 n=1 Tax=Genypterus blacodes TaxID=154954 RepID=UPI003F768420